jgi:hypothetical protein
MSRRLGEEETGNKSKNRLPNLPFMVFSPGSLPESETVICGWTMTKKRMRTLRDLCNSLFASSWKRTKQLFSPMIPRMKFPSGREWNCWATVFSHKKQVWLQRRGRFPLLFICLPACVETDRCTPAYLPIG